MGHMKKKTIEKNIILDNKFPRFKGVVYAETVVYLTSCTLDSPAFGIKIKYTFELFQANLGIGISVFRIYHIQSRNEIVIQLAR